MQTTLNIVIDIETLGNFYGGAVIEIGAAAFPVQHMPVAGCPDVCHEDTMWTFSRAINLDASLALGFQSAQENRLWWRSHKEVLDSILQEGRDLERCAPKAAITAFRTWLSELGDCPHRIYWGNGPEFDMSILQAYFDVLSIPLPWTYRQLASFRSLRALCPDFAAPDIVNKAPHRALSDAIYEARLLRRFMQTRLVHNVKQPADETADLAEQDAAPYPDQPGQPARIGKMHRCTLPLPERRKD